MVRPIGRFIAFLLAVGAVVPSAAAQQWTRSGGEEDPVGRRSPLTFVKHGRAVEPVRSRNAVAGVLIECEQTPPAILVLIDNAPALTVAERNGTSGDGFARLDAGAPQEIKWFKGPGDAMAAQLTPASRYYVATEDSLFWSRIRTALRPGWRPAVEAPARRTDVISMTVTMRSSVGSPRRSGSGGTVEGLFVSRRALSDADSLTVSAPTGDGDIYYRFDLDGLEDMEARCDPGRSPDDDRAQRSAAPDDGIAATTSSASADPRTDRSLRIGRERRIGPESRIEPEATSYRVPRSPGDRFQECPQCPEMVVVPPGTFMMGSASSEPHRHSDEGPLHSVTIGAPFAVGVYEVTVREWNECALAGACRSVPRDIAELGANPMRDVSWDDAQSYVAWLSAETGAEYRLLSEAEWEYVARAGTQTARYWGDDESRHGLYEHVGLTAAELEARIDTGLLAADPVGSRAPNPFGLHDVLGNVSEWTQDCAHTNYSGAPVDGSAWTEECFTDKAGWTLRSIRGGYSVAPLPDVRVAFRGVQPSNFRFPGNGLRVARSLD